MPITIKRIQPLETYSVRHPVLRAGRPVKSCAMQGDDLPTTIHLGAYDNNLHVGVATFLKSNAQESPVADQDASFYQLRGMGVLATHQGNGIGKQLLTHGLKVLKNKNIDLVWCNARIAAISFYERANFLKYGEPFEVEHIGKHYKMVKRL